MEFSVVADAGAAPVVGGHALLVRDLQWGLVVRGGTQQDGWHRSRQRVPVVASQVHAWHSDTKRSSPGAMTTGSPGWGTRHPASVLLVFSTPARGQPKSNYPQ